MSQSVDAPKLNADAEQTAPWLRRTGLIAGLLLFALTRILPPPEGMDAAAEAATRPETSNPRVRARWMFSTLRKSAVDAIRSLRRVSCQVTLIVPARGI